MNFNLDFFKPFTLIGKNYKQILKAAGWLFGGMILFAAMIFAIAFAAGAGVKAWAIALSTFAFIVLLLIFAFFAIGFFYEIMHNFILEKEDFMPTVKGRFGEYISKGFKLFLLSLIPAVILVAICFLIGFYGIFLAYTGGADWSLQILAFIFLITYFMNIIFMPFVSAYVHNFDMKNVFKKNNFTILRNSFPELIYSVVAPIVLSYVVQICLLIAIVICCLLVVPAVAFLCAAKWFVPAIILGALFVTAILFVSMFMSIAVCIYQLSLFAQSYNYGKYFLCMGEAPKRKTIEWLVPVLVLLMCVLAQVGLQSFNDKINAQENQKASMQKIIEKIKLNRNF